MGDFEIWIGATIVFSVLCAGIFTWHTNSRHGHLWLRFIAALVGYTVVGLVIVGGLYLIFAD